jgi:hypothetical protein
MTLDRTALRISINDLYSREHEELGDSGTYAMLEEASQWDVSQTLGDGGVVTFAHVNVADCGLHVAAAVNGALDTGAETVLAISVLHAFTEEMELARRDVTSAGASPSNPDVGIQGPGLDFRDEWRGDHAMRSLRHFWEAETRRRGITGRRLVERYPFLAGGRPGDLPNVDEVSVLAEDAVILATGDQFHHGIAYGTPAEEALDLGPEGLEAARHSMETGIDLIERGDLAGYDTHCVIAKRRPGCRPALPLPGRTSSRDGSGIGLLGHRGVVQTTRAPRAAGGFIKFDKV